LMDTSQSQSRCTRSPRRSPTRSHCAAADSLDHGHGVALAHTSLEAEHGQPKTSLWQRPGCIRCRREFPARWTGPALPAPRRAIGSRWQAAEFIDANCFPHQVIEDARHTTSARLIAACRWRDCDAVVGISAVRYTARTMRRVTRVLAPISLVVSAAVIGAGRTVDGQAQPFDPARSRPLEIARALAARYPASPIMSYIPAMAWSASLRLAQLTGEERWKDKPRREMQPFTAGEKPALAEPFLLTSLAGHAAWFDLGTSDRNAAAAALASKAAAFVIPDVPDEIVKFRRNWTDDMFMASSLLSRAAAHDTSQGERYARAVGRLLTTYAESLQRPDGIFIHAKEGPHAWGRGNGFALMGLTDALTHLPGNWPDRPRVLEIYRKHVMGLIPLASDDGSWREVVDEPASYRELTVTALTVAALARGVRLGWLDASVRPVIDKGWRAVVARVNEDGTVRDVCASTGAGPTKDYYLNRPVVNGADDRGGAMALLAAIEMEELSRAK
jgi:unsaturated rhamnogalacturonyl hydrolase